MQGLGHAHASQSPEPDLALSPEHFGRLHHLAQHIFDADGSPRQIPLGTHPVVELYQVHLLTSHSGKAGINRADNAPLDVRAVLGFQAVLGTHVYLGIQLIQNPAQVSFRLA